MLLVWIYVEDVNGGEETYSSASSVCFGLAGINGVVAERDASCVRVRVVVCTAGHFGCIFWLN